MSERTDLSQIQSNYTSPDIILRPEIDDNDLQLEESRIFVPEDTPGGMPLDHLARRGKRIIRTYLAAGALVLAGSIVVTEHYKADLKAMQRHAIDQVVNHSIDYAVDLKSETVREFDKIAPPSKPSLEAPGPLIGASDLSTHPGVMIGK